MSFQDEEGDDWGTIESDPGVFTALLDDLGCRGIQLTELWSADDESLIALEEGGELRGLTDIDQQQVYGLIFLFGWDAVYQKMHATSPDVQVLRYDSEEGNAEEGTGGGPRRPPDSLFFAHQMTTNACATQAILSVLFNTQSLLSANEGTDGASSLSSSLGVPLTEFRNLIMSFPSPELRGEAIKCNDMIRQAHNAFGRGLDLEIYTGHLTKRKRQNQKRKKGNTGEAFHFVAYVPHATTAQSTEELPSNPASVVFELDGLQAGPIMVGTTEAGSAKTDWLKIAGQAVRQRMEILSMQSDHRDGEGAAASVKFNLMAIIRDPAYNIQQSLHQQPSSAAAGDAQSHHLQVLLAQESMKRDTWTAENERRQHNYVPLCIQLLKELAALPADNTSHLSTLIDAARKKQVGKRKQPAASINLKK
jgi:ubiquitin carboxyl-terminal hydrolase L5